MRASTVALLVAFAGTLNAAEPDASTSPTLSPLETSRLTYSSNLGDKFEAVAQALDRGYPLGSYVGKEAATSARITSVSDLAQALESSVKELEKASQESRQKAFERYLALHGALSGSTTPGAQPAPAVPPVEPFDEKKFLECAARTLPVLKERLQMEQMGDTLNLGLLDRQLSQERGNGVEVGPAGMACGKYMGRRGAGAPSTIEEIKLLSALQARTETAEREYLWKVFCLRNQAITQGSSLGTFWVQAWQRVAFLAVFSPKGLPDVQQMAQDFFVRNFANPKWESSLEKESKKKFLDQVLADWNESLPI